MLDGVALRGSEIGCAIPDAQGFALVCHSARPLGPSEGYETCDSAGQLTPCYNSNEGQPGCHMADGAISRELYQQGGLGLCKQRWTISKPNVRGRVWSTVWNIMLTRLTDLS